MKKFVSPLLKQVNKLAKKPNLKAILKLNRWQWIKLVAGFVAVYLVILVVNILVLQSQIDGNNSRIGGIRRTVNALSLNFNLASKILDQDLQDQQAVGRVGGHYLTEERFNQLVVSEKKLRQSKKLKTSESNARALTDKVLDRMLIEQLVGEYAREHNFTADPADVEARITANLRSLGSLEKLEAVLKQSYNWTLPDFRYEIEYSILKAKMEEDLGGAKFADLAKSGLQNAKTPKVQDYADNFARTHTNYLVSGGIDTLAKRFLDL